MCTCPLGWSAEYQNRCLSKPPSISLMLCYEYDNRQWTGEKSPPWPNWLLRQPLHLNGYCSLSIYKKYITLGTKLYHSLFIVWLFFFFNVSISFVYLLLLFGLVIKWFGNKIILTKEVVFSTKIYIENNKIGWGNMVDLTVLLPTYLKTTNMEPPTLIYQSLNLKQARRQNGG